MEATGVDDLVLRYRLDAAAESRLIPVRAG